MIKLQCKMTVIIYRLKWYVGQSENEQNKMLNINKSKTRRKIKKTMLSIFCKTDNHILGIEGTQNTISFHNERHENKWIKDQGIKDREQ